MEKNGNTIRIFMLPSQASSCEPSSCGPSCCCGPVGQSAEEIQALQQAIEQEFGVKVEVCDAMDGRTMRNHLEVVRLVRSFGAMALPLITVNDDVATMGNLAPADAVSAIREKINQLEETHHANV